MSNRILIIGYVLMEYLGEKSIDYRAKMPVGERKFMKVHKGDRVVADEVTAITLCRGTQWQEVECDVDISTLFASVQKKPIKEEDEPIKEMTQSNLDSFNDDELIAFAKEKKVTGVTVRSSRDKIIPLILPFLPAE